MTDLSDSLHEDSTRPPFRGARPVVNGTNGSATGLLKPRSTRHSSTSLLQKQFGDYELEDEIARGGMGIVYKARQVSLNRTVALKMIIAGRLASAADIEQFYSEAKAAAALNHPGIVQIHEVGQIGDQHFFSMEYVAGQTLAQRLIDGPLPPEEAAVLVANVADAVEFAHSAGIVHRDIKPANIILDASGHPHITDFGVALYNEGGTTIESSTPVGTVSFMPPEQAAGDLDLIGPASDIYSLGATLYCLLAGHPPFRAANPSDTLVQVISREPIPLRRLNDRIPIDLETITAKCLEKDPTRRYPNAQELALDLRRFLMLEPIQARPTSQWAHLVKWSRRNPSLALLTAVLIASVAALFATGLMYNSLLRQERTLAQSSERRALQLLGLSDALLTELGQRRNAATVDFLQQAMSLGRLRATTHRVVTSMSRDQAVVPIEVFEHEAAFFSDKTAPQLRPLIDRTQDAIRDWADGPVPPNLRDVADDLQATCIDIWRELVDTDPEARDHVARVVRTQLAQTINLILASRSRTDAADLISRFERLRTGVLPIVGLRELNASCSSLANAFDRWPTQQTGRQLERSLPASVWPWPELVE
ncbi:protein kinase [bacterium]|nr:protein kinase [bacterium]